MPPEICSCAPLDTVVAPPVDPNALLLAATRIPSLSVVAPVYELLPDSVSVLSPDLTTEPPEPEITPANVVDLPDAPLTVSVLVGEPLVLRVIVAPEPDPDVLIDATVSEYPAMLNDALLAIDTADESEIRFSAPSASVPAEMVVVPVYVLLPEMVNVPDPDFVKPPVPDMTPL